MFSPARKRRPLQLAILAALITLSSGGAANASTAAQDAQFNALANLDVNVNQALEAASATGSTFGATANTG